VYCNLDDVSIQGIRSLPPCLHPIEVPRKVGVLHCYSLSTEGCVDEAFEMHVHGMSLSNRTSMAMQADLFAVL
jgi:hypothetical protein